MTFFINRVTYTNNKLEKDSRCFNYNDSIKVHKQQVEKTKTDKVLER
jgi:hypothetical protein